MRQLSIIFIYYHHLIRKITWGIVEAQLAISCVHISHNYRLQTIFICINILHVPFAYFKKLLILVIGCSIITLIITYLRYSL